MTRKKNSGNRTFALLLMLASPFLLAQQAELTTSDAIDRQIRLLQESTRTSVRREAILQLSGQPGTKINEAMILAMDDDDAEVRKAAVYHFQNARLPLPESVLQKATQDRSSMVREAALWTLMISNPEQHVSVVSAALDDTVPAVRKAAIWAAGNFSQAFEPELSAQVVKLFDQCFREECSAIIWVLLKHRDRLPDSVRSKLAKKHSTVRATAAEAIGTSAASAEIATVQALAVDLEPEVRVAAAAALGTLAENLDGDENRDLLLSLFGDDDPRVRFAAAGALESVGFVGLAHSIDYVEGRAEVHPVAAEIDQASLAPVLIGLSEKLRGDQRRRLANLLMSWRYEPAVENGLVLVASLSIRDRMTGWHGLIGYRNAGYLGKAALATLRSPWTLLHLLVVAALLAWAVWTYRNLDQIFAKQETAKAPGEKPDNDRQALRPHSAEKNSKIDRTENSISSTGTFVGKNKND